MPPLPKIPGRGGRPIAPPELSPRERVIWDGVVSSRPLHYFDAGTLPMLAGLCMLTMLAEDVAAELRIHPTDRLKREYRQQMAAIATLSTRLRLGKISGRKHQTSEALEARAPRRRLWLAHSEPE